MVLLVLFLELVFRENVKQISRNAFVVGDRKCMRAVADLIKIITYLGEPGM